MDADAVARLQTQSERIGLQISTGVRIERIEATGERFRVIFTHEGTEKTVEAGSSMARVVSPMSRASRSPGQVDHDNGRIATDNYLRSTSNSRVYV